MRVQRSFGFLDLSGFTALTEAEGDEEAVAVVSSFRSLVRQVCSRRGVRIAKWLGDGAMLVSVDGFPLVATALELQHATEGLEVSTHLRCGLSSGAVILLEGDDYIGHAVNLAARLCDLAPAQVVLAAETIVGDLPKWGVVLSQEVTAVRGLERPLPVARLGLREVGTVAIADPVCGIPLTADVAEETVVDGIGREVWFCSDSCRDTWERRPRHGVERPGSLRTPLIGS